jgi:hypothetical protein
MPKEHYVGAAAFEYSREFYRLASGDNGISITGANENGKIAKIPNYVGREGHHRSEEHGSREIMWVEQNQTGCDVRPVGITNGNNASQYGFGIVSARIAEMVLRDERSAIPIGSYQQKFGVTLSLPSVVGRRGVTAIFPPDLSAGEQDLLHKSAENLRAALQRVRS